MGASRAARNRGRVVTGPAHGVERPKYRSVEARLAGRKPLAVWLEVDGVRAWVPRTCLCALTDRAVETAGIGEVIHARVMVWKADRLGWTGRTANHPKLL